MMRVGRLVVALACAWEAQGHIDASVSSALATDDACNTGGVGTQACNLGLMQKRRAFESAGEANTTWQDGIVSSGSRKLALPVIFGYSRRDIRGIENCYGKNVGYCNHLMFKAHSYCAGSRCVQIVNPPGHRTRTPLHIHSYHYNGHGASLKRRLESRVCKSGGWVSGGFPCGGRAKYFGGFPAVFSVAGGGISHACLTVWPGSCGGGTIVLVSFHCSIEHSISRR
mmetsp:Transcript_61854/g.191651  ORF Transcript_61854/g.191651 Transcript_61854/m.191651 type:complete len:226 (+) Transcript_61854:91-768(+)